MGIHEFICRATKGEEACLLTYDLSKKLNTQKKEIEQEYMRKKALQSGIVLCYNA